MKSNRRKALAMTGAALAAPVSSAVALASPMTEERPDPNSPNPQERMSYHAKHVARLLHEMHGGEWWITQSVETHTVTVFSEESKKARNGPAPRFVELEKQYLEAQAKAIEFRGTEPYENLSEDQQSRWKDLIKLECRAYKQLDDFVPDNLSELCTKIDWLLRDNQHIKPDDIRWALRALNAYRPVA